MARGMTGNNGTKKNTSFIMILAILAMFYPVVLYAAASVVIQKPQGVGGTNSPIGRRGAPVAGASTVHKGLDYQAQPGVVVPTNAPVTCRINGGGLTKGYGRYADATQNCDAGGTVTERYAHLSACTNGGRTVTTGATGNISGPHLHYEVRLDGSPIDPAAAYGKNLCDPKVRAELLADARAKGLPGGGGGAVAPANPTQTPPAGGGGTPPPTPTAPAPAGPPYEPAPPQPHIVPGVFPPTTDMFVPETVTDNEVTGCATDTWRAMVNQSVLQTRREMLMNERYIAKADSVLAYSCFEDFYWAAGDTLPIFSESQRWTNAQVDIIGRTVTLNVDMGSSSLDGAIANAVDSAVLVYLDTHFNHEFLGGLLTGPLGAAPAAQANGGDDDDGPSQYGYACGKMREVWQMAKCHNVTDEPLFYKFEDLIDNDPRIYPHNYACTDSGIFQTMIDTAQHESVAFDDIVTHLDMIYPENGACAPPIPTGVQVTVRKGADRITEEVSYDDGLCMTLGCSYQNPDTAGLGTCEIKGQ